MPITSAARRASLESSRVQHPRAPVRYDRGLLDSAMWTPVTSCPASAARAAATAESTPPDMAASMRKVIVLRAYAAWPDTPNSFTRTIVAAMGIFRRPREASPATPPAISEFWEWWAQARPTIEASLAAGPGGGGPELRGLTERWARSAPSGPAAGGWSFHPARQRDPEMLTQDLMLGDHEFDLEYVRLGMRADTDRARVHVTVYHPDFLFVSEEQRLQVALNVLNWALGEDDVARWIGEVAIATEAPIDALPPSIDRKG